MHPKAETDLGERKDRLIHEHIHDPYKIPRKLRTPSVCPECGAVFVDGRWRWSASPPSHADRELCQACHRIRDKYPAGIVTLSGGFVAKNKAELLHLARENKRILCIMDIQSLWTAFSLLPRISTCRGKLAKLFAVSQGASRPSLRQRGLLRSRGVAARSVSPLSDGRSQ